MKVLAVGGGGREHAIVETLRRSDARVFSIMKNRNPGIARASEDFLLCDETNVEKVVAWAARVGVDLAVVGPEAPLGYGLVDQLEAVSIPVVGPSREAARIELSKEFARDLMRRHAIPGLVEYQAFDDIVDARRYMKEVNYPIVVKPIGLTGGKGVKVMGDHLHTKEEALAYVQEVLERRIGGQSRVLIERREDGEEFSLQAFTDGKHLAPMPLVQDYKRAEESDRGPNTGGMGSISVADGLLPFLRREDYETAVTIMRKAIEAMRSEGVPYKGILYGGFISTPSGPKILEFNARFGDPEAMNVLPMLEHDFLEVLWSIVDGKLKEGVSFRRKATVCKYVVPEGYGTKPLADQELHVDETAIQQGGAILYYASVDEQDGRIFTTTSRALAVVGVADDLGSAESLAEEGLAHVRGRVFMRHDIGKSSLVEQKVERMRALRGG
ncbi:MAG: phosphoribosylamine--glycine ligase [Thermoplasmata archaeon]